jgi:hypothetical protein
VQKPGAEQLKEKLPGRKLYKWYYSYAEGCGGDGEVFQENWLGAVAHYKTKLELTVPSAVLLHQFLILFAEDINSYVFCHSTALVERLHNLSNKYISKQLHYGFKRYCACKSQCWTGTRTQRRRT